MATRLYPNAATVPRVISEFMSAVRCDRARHPVRWIGHPVYPMTGAISASCSHGFISHSGTHMALNSSTAITATNTGADSTAPTSTRRVRSRISAARSSASASSGCVGFPSVSSGSRGEASAVSVRGATSAGGSPVTLRTPETMFIPHANR